MPIDESSNSVYNSKSFIALVQCTDRSIIYRELERLNRPVSRGMITRKSDESMFFDSFLFMQMETE
jgi:hypothetical protein